MIRPLKLFVPTATTTYLPMPSKTLLPLRMKQSACVPVSVLIFSSISSYEILRIASDSPVAPDSSHRTLCPERKTPSHGIISPGSRRAISPTKTSYLVVRIRK